MQRRVRVLLLGCALGSVGCPSATTPSTPPTPADTEETGHTTVELQVTIEPTQPRAGLDTLTCQAPGAEAFAWFLDGQPVADGAAVSQHDVVPGTWRCEVEAAGMSAAAEVEVTPIGGNVLVLLLDDLGLDKVSGYGVHAEAPDTPRLDALADEGVRFRNAYALPLCSPTRMALLTGRLPSRTGVGNLIPANTQADWLEGEDTLPQMLSRAPGGPYTSALAGKWHLGHAGDGDAPVRAGFAWHAGSMNNPRIAFQSGGGDLSYLHWEKNDNGAYAFVDTYMTADTTDDAIAQLASLPEPWWLYVPFNAAHEPWHGPPEELSGVDPSTLGTDRDKMDAMVVALDTEIGRLLDAMTEAQRATTTIVVMGDNGTQQEVVRPPLSPDRSKGSLYEAGVRVPLIVVAPWLAGPGRESEALVHVVDVFPTLAALAGVPLDDGVVRDGLSWIPLLADPAAAWPRQYLYAEKFDPNGFAPTARWYTLRDDLHKLRVDRNGDVGFFELTPGGLDEGPDLLDGTLTADQQAAYERLVAEADRVTTDLWP